MEIEKRRNYNFYDILGDRAKLWFTLMYGRLLLKRLIIVDVVKTGGGGGPSAFLFTGSLSRNYAAFIWRRRERRKTRGHLSTEKLFFGLTGGDKSVETRAFSARLSDIARFLTARYHTTSIYVYIFPASFLPFNSSIFQSATIARSLLPSTHTYRIVSCRNRNRRLSSIVNFSDNH